jgi:2,3-bisphosphoglycerate-independent phosphoglycerate mutase
VNTFDVHDLDTCDKVVYDNLPSAVTGAGQNYSKDSFIVAHLLGIDHVGHSTSSLDDSMMEVKMKEMSGFLEGVFEKAEDNTFFLVTGDHGMR